MYICKCTVYFDGYEKTFYMSDLCPQLVGQHHVAWKKIIRVYKSDVSRHWECNLLTRANPSLSFDKLRCSLIGHHFKIATGGWIGSTSISTNIIGFGLMRVFTQLIFPPQYHSTPCQSTSRATNLSCKPAFRFHARQSYFDARNLI